MNNDEEVIEGDEEWCDLHAQDGNKCEAEDNAGEEGSPPYTQCRRWRWEQYLRGEVAESIADAAREHFGEG